MRGFLCILICACVVGRQAAAQEVPLVERQVENFFAPDTNLLQIKIEGDRLAGDSSEGAETRKAFESLSSSLEIMADANANARERYLRLRHFISDVGDWNGQASFGYDLTDPLGHVPQNRFLSHYLRERKGNCITMPLLALLLGRRVGLKMTLALAPFHEFIKLTDDDGREINLEATSGLGPARDQRYRDELPMSDVAVAKGTYLRGLREEELIAVVAEPVVRHALEVKDYWQAIKVADVLLKHFPTCVALLLERGSAYGHLLEEEYLKPFGQNIPPELLPIARGYHDRNMADFRAAEALGWREDEGQKGHAVQ